MRNHFICPALCLLFAAASGAAHAANIPGNAEYRPGEILVGYRNGTDHAALTKSAMGLLTKRALADGRVELLQLPQITDVEHALPLLLGDPAVEYAEPNFLRHKSAAIPNDPQFSDQWGIQNTGQANFFAGGPAGVAGGDMHLTQAWDANSDGVADHTGDGSVTVAIVDDGFQLNHPDLAANFLPGFDFKNNDSDPSSDSSDEFHGTLVAGCIGAIGNNGVGIAGAAWNVKMLPIKFGFDTASEVAAFAFARDHGAKIVNTSFGGPGFSQTEFNAISDLEQHDILLVAAAGNDNSNTDFAQIAYPANYNLPNIVAVAATNRQDNVASFSQYGSITVDVAAPGLQIVTTQIGSSYSTNPGVSGTSFSSPYTAGVAALIRMYHPTADYKETRARLIEGADAGGDVSLRVAGGRINAQRSLDMSPTPNLVIDSVQISGGDGNGALDPGESLTLDITLRNNWLAATGVSASLSADNNVVNAAAGAQSFGDIPAGGSAVAHFPITVPATLSGHNYVDFRLVISAGGGYSARRSFIEEVAQLQDGQTVTQSIQTDLYDEFHSWHINVPAGKSSLTFHTTSSQDIDILVKQGTPPQYLISLGVDTASSDQIYCTSGTTSDCMDPNTMIGGSNTGNETVTIPNPAAGIWYVTVVNYAQVDNTSYTLNATTTGPTPTSTPTPTPTPTPTSTPTPTPTPILTPTPTSTPTPIPSPTPTPTITPTPTPAPAAASASSGGGGGSMPVISLALLCLLQGLRRRIAEVSHV